MLHLHKTLALRSLSARLIAGHRSYSKDYDSSDDEKNIKNTKKPKPSKVPSSASVTDGEESAATKLNRLLASMQTDDNMNPNRTNDIVAKPGEANKRRKLQVKQQADSKDIFAAAKRVASMLGDENKQVTESELLSKLLGGKTANADATKVNDAKPSADISLSDLIVGMKIDRSQKQNETFTRSDYVRRSIASKGRQQQQQQPYQKYGDKQKRPTQRKREAEAYTGSVNLFGSKPLGIFKDPNELKDSSDILATWSYLQEQALKIQVSHPPNNYFDKLALWTEQGKLWRFPIDNEQDWLEEKGVDFSEHIFLEQHLEGWCPTKGPIRHFMELVCVGLSKTPFITAADKKDHILWYRDYFETKREILKDLMAQEAKGASTKSDKKIDV